MLPITHHKVNRMPSIRYAHPLIGVALPRIHDILKPHIDRVLTGKRVHCKVEWPRSGMGATDCDVMLLPVPPDTECPAGFVRERADFAKARAKALACRRLGMRTIAEFVESDDTLARLREIGIDYAQGFGIGKPGPIGNSG